MEKNQEIKENNKQTAVEWLFHKLWDEPKDKFTWYTLLKQAKEMEKEQIVNLIQFMRTQDKMGKSIKDLFEQYYNETYGNKRTDT